MKTKPKLKARRMWADSNGTYLFSKKPGGHYSATRVAVIPLDDMDALVAVANDAYNAEPTMSSSNGMIAALTAIDLLPVRKGRK